MKVPHPRELAAQVFLPGPLLVICGIAVLGLVGLDSPSTRLTMAASVLALALPVGLRLAAGSPVDGREAQDSR